MATTFSVQAAAELSPYTQPSLAKYLPDFLYHLDPAIGGGSAPRIPSVTTTLSGALDDKREVDLRSQPSRKERSDI